jgi:hypothetical protein
MNSLGLRCVEDDDLYAWIDAARMAKSNGRPIMRSVRNLKELFCSDCTSEYEQQMKAEGRCTKVEVKA